VLKAVLSLAAEIAAVRRAKRRGGGPVLGLEVARATIGHECVHEEVELDVAIVGGERGGEEGEVVV
jgi:hypothetical protein